MGTAIHRKTLERCTFEREVAIQAAEVAVWKQAEAIREEALVKATKRTKLEHEKIIAKLNKAQERALRVSSNSQLVFITFLFQYKFLKVYITVSSHLSHLYVYWCKLARKDSKSVLFNYGW